MVKNKITQIFNHDNGAGGGLGKKIKTLSELNPEIASEVNFNAETGDIKNILIRKDIEPKKEKIVREFAEKYGIPISVFRIERKEEKPWVVISRDLLEN